jgi:hypothetical protein
VARRHPSLLGTLLYNNSVRTYVRSTVSELLPPPPVTERSTCCTPYISFPVSNSQFIIARQTNSSEMLTSDATCVRDPHSVSNNVDARVFHHRSCGWEPSPTTRWSTQTVRSPDYNWLLFRRQYYVVFYTLDNNTMENNVIFCVSLVLLSN